MTAEKLDPGGGAGPRGIVAVLTAAPSQEEGLRLARALVTERLAACANVVPGVRSVFWWNGGVEEADEVLVVVKTTRERAADACARLVGLHPYSVPEAVTLEVSGGSAAYLAWVAGETAALAGREGNRA